MPKLIAKNVIQTPNLILFLTKLRKLEQKLEILQIFSFS